MASVIFTYSDQHYSYSYTYNVCLSVHLFSCYVRGFVDGTFSGTFRLYRGGGWLLSRLGSLFSFDRPTTCRGLRGRRNIEVKNCGLQRKKGNDGKGIKCENLILILLQSSKMKWS